MRVERLKLNARPDRLFVDVDVPPADLAARCVRLLDRHGESVEPLVTCIEGDLVTAPRARYFDRGGERDASGAELYWTNIYRMMSMIRMMAARDPRVRKATEPLMTRRGPVEFIGLPRTGNYTLVCGPAGEDLGTYNEFDWAVLAPNPNWMNQIDELLLPAGPFD